MHSKGRGRSNDCKCVREILDLQTKQGAYLNEKGAQAGDGGRKAKEMSQQN